MDIERIVVRLMADATQYNRAMANAVTSLHTVVRQASNLGPAFDNGIRVPALLAAGAIGAVSLAAGAAVYEGVKLAASYEQVSIAFEVMTGSAAKGQALLEEINQLAIKTPFRSTELFENAKLLKAFGVETNQVIPALEVLGDVSAGTGSSLHRIALAFGQVMTAGRLTGQEFRQFVNAGVPLVENLSVVMDKPVSSLQHLVRQGKVTANDVIDAFNRMTSNGNTFADMMTRLNDTVPGQWSTLIENLEFVARNLGLAFFEGTRLKDQLKGVNEWLGGVRDDLNAPGRGGWTEFFANIRSGILWVKDQWYAFKQAFTDGFSFEDLRAELAGTGMFDTLSDGWDRFKEAVLGFDLSGHLRAVRDLIIDVGLELDEKATLFARVGISVFRGVRDEAVRLKDEAVKVYEQAVMAFPVMYEQVKTFLRDTADQVKLAFTGITESIGSQLGVSNTLHDAQMTYQVLAAQVVGFFRDANDAVTSMDVNDVTNQLIVAVGLATAAYAAFRVGLVAWSAAAATYSAVVGGMSAGLGVLRGVVVSVYTTWAAFNAVMNTTVVSWAGIRAAAQVLFSSIAGFASGTVALFTAIPGALANLMVFLGPALALGGIIATLTYSLDLTKAWRTVVDELVGLFRGLVDTVSMAAEGFSNAVKANDMKLAWEIAFKGIELAWQQTVNALRLIWLKFKADNLEGATDNVRTSIARTLIGSQKEIEQASAFARFKANVNSPGVTDSDQKRFLAAYQQELARIEAEAKADLESLNSAAKEASVERVRATIGAAGGEKAIRENGVGPLQDQLKLLVEQAKVKEQMAAAAKEELKISKEMAYWTREADLNNERAYQSARSAVLDLSKKLATASGTRMGESFPNVQAGASAGMAAAAKFLNLPVSNMPGYFRGGYGIAPYDPANAFGAAIGGIALPDPVKVREYIAKLFLPDPKVAEFADKLNKTFEKGVTDAQKLGTEIDYIFRARGVQQQALGAALGAAAAQFAPQPQITDEMKNMALFQTFQDAVKYVKEDMEVKQPPTLTAGSQQAMDAINKANLQLQADNLKVIDVLQAANLKHDRQIAEAKRVADAMEAAARNGVTLVPKKLEPKR